MEVSCVVLMSGMNVRCTMDVLLAISAMHRSVKMPNYKPIAVQYYVSAISSLRTKVERKEVDGTEDWLLLMSLLLCLFEVR